MFRYLRHKEGTRRKSLGLYLPHPLLTHITRWRLQTLSSFMAPEVWKQTIIIYMAMLPILSTEVLSSSHWGSEWVTQEDWETAVDIVDLSSTSPLGFICSSFPFPIVFQSCDLWSLGVIIYVMLCGYPPFYSKHHSRTIPKDMRKKIMTGSFDFPEDEWSQISEMAKDIVRKWAFFCFALAPRWCPSCIVVISTLCCPLLLSGS